MKLKFRMKREIEGGERDRERRVRDRENVQEREREDEEGREREGGTERER